MNDAKLSHYTQGTVRKSRREKEKEAAEAKKLQEEQEAAIAYAEFVDAFDSGPSSTRRTSAFVKAGAAPNPPPPRHSRPVSTQSMFDDGVRARYRFLTCC